MQRPTEHTLEKELKRFQVLYDLAIAMTADHTLEENLQVVVDKSRELLETDTAYVALRDDVQGDVYMHTLSGIQTEAFKKLRLPFGKGVGGLVAKTRRGLIVEDYFAEKTINHVVDKVVADEGIISGMAAPIQMGPKNLGVFFVFNRKKTPFSEFDLDTLTLLGNLAAVEISRQQAEETVRRDQEELEKRVKERTGELIQTNTRLKQEIQERKQSEEALRKSEERYRTLVEKLPIGVYRCTPGEEGEFFMANPAFLKMFGYESEEALKRVRVSDIYMDHSERKLFSDSLLAMKSGTVTDRRLKKKDGTPLWGTVTARVAYEEGSEKIAYFDCAIQDITERRQAERALRESEEKYRDLFENSSDLLCFHDMQGNLLDANLAFKKGYGFSGKDVLHANVRDFIPERYKHEFEDYMKRIREKGRDEGFMRIAVKGGREIVVEYGNSVVRDSEGKPVGVRGSARDVTERIKAEREKKKLQAQLIQAQRIEAVGTLAGGIAHNFNNLLMGIQGNASLARMETDPSNPIHRKLENIEKLVKSGAKLTNQLLAYAREGRYEVRSISLNQLVRETSSTFAEARKDIKVFQDIGEDLMGIEADQGQMEQVVLNLLVNAADAMPSGGRVVLKTRNVSHEEMAGKSYKAKSGKYVLLEVSDTGVGMDKKTMERIFEPFFTTKGLGKGTGLGLASVYGIIKGHGGYIDVHSEQRKGTTFEIYLPASEREITGEKEMTEGIILGSETVLLVDDEDVITDVGKQMIEKLGYNVLTASSGKEAIKVYRQNLDKINLVVLDMIMPDTGGGEAYDQLKGINPDVKVLLSSGYSIDGQAKEILDRGCSGFIKKPFDMKALSRALREILDS